MSSIQTLLPGYHNKSRGLANFAFFAAAAQAFGDANAVPMDVMAVVQHLVGHRAKVNLPVVFRTMEEINERLCRNKLPTLYSADEYTSLLRDFGQNAARRKKEAATAAASSSFGVGLLGLGALVSVMPTLPTVVAFDVLQAQAHGENAPVLPVAFWIW